MAAGFYEQCDFRSASDRSATRPAVAVSGSLDVSGQVARPGLIGSPVLRSLAGGERLSDFDARCIPVTDFLSEVRLLADADLILFRGTDGSRIVTRVARLLADPRATLIIGGTDLTARACWTKPVVMRSSSLPERREIEIVSMTALTFAEFIGGAR